MADLIEIELTEDEMAALLAASKPTPVMYGNGGTPLFSSSQENANRAWAALGKKRGFAYMTVRPVPGKGQQFITAEPSPRGDRPRLRW